MDSLSSVAQAISECRQCERLVQWREKVSLEKRAAFVDDEYWGRGVPGFGDSSAKVIVIGLAPAAHGANRTGRVFTGDRSGDFLFASMHRTGFANQALARRIDDGLQLFDAYVTAAVRCAPPANKPTTVERDTCRPFIERELLLLTEATVFVALGQFGYQVACSILGVRPRPRFGHGVVVPLEDEGICLERHIICSFHPSQQNTFTGRLTEEMLDDVFIRARELGGLEPL
jgi:uracil-DNA glycosylase family 4